MVNLNLLHNIELRLCILQLQGKKNQINDFLKIWKQTPLNIIWPWYNVFLTINLILMCLIELFRFLPVVKNFLKIINKNRQKETNKGHQVVLYQVHNYLFHRMMILLEIIVYSRKFEKLFWSKCKDYEKSRL